MNEKMIFSINKNKKNIFINIKIQKKWFLLKKEAVK